MLTFEQLNEHADTLEKDGMISENELIVPEGAKASPAEVMSKVCGIYQKVRPFLELAANLFFLPKKWRTPIQSFMLVLDGLCPQE
jgi:hypothetical protein